MTQANADVETKTKMSPAGLEKVAKSLEKTKVAAKGAAKSGAISTESAITDADLATVVTAWPTLPQATR